MLFLSKKVQCLNVYSAMEYIIAIIGILVGIIGGLGGALTSSHAKNRQLKAENKVKDETIEINKEITEIVTKKDERKSDIKSGTIKSLMLLISSAFLLNGCTSYVAMTPSLIKIEKPNDFKDIKYQIIDNTYVFDENNMQELLRQTDWCSNAVKKYEEQIDVVLRYQNNK